MKIQLAVLALLSASQAIRIAKTETPEAVEETNIELPAFTDANDVKLEKEMDDEMKNYQTLAASDQSHIEAFTRSLAQSQRNAGQGELGRALGVSKIQDIKTEIQTLSQNLQKEGEALQHFSQKMTMMHQPKKLEVSGVAEMQKKAEKILSQLSNINDLEEELEIQKEDKELSVIEKKISTVMAQTKEVVDKAGKTVIDHLGKQPDADKIMTEEQYQQQLSFVLKH